ncbi:MAG: proteasome accessory factor PafA2 family protein [Candidatus Bathyarchaeia archaeon]
MGFIDGRIRGIEYEYAIDTHPSLTSSILRNRVISSAIMGLKEQGYISEVDWSIDDEIGNLEYEQGLPALWMAPVGPFEAALNGSRVYNDAEHFEVSTPAYRTPFDAVVYDKVGEIFAYWGAKATEKEFRRVFAYKNNVSTTVSDGRFESVTYGTHSCISLDRRVCNIDRWDEVERALVPYMVSRIPLIGGGEYVTCTKEGKKLEFVFPHLGAPTVAGNSAVFTISPRSAFLKRISALDTSLMRGILNLRDEPHANPEKYWRLHDINWEAARNEFHIFVRDVLQVFVMCAFERGLLDDAPRLRDPLNSAMEVSLDTEDYNWRVELADGRRVDCVSEILDGFYLAKIEEMVSQEEASAQDKMALDILKATVQKLSERSLEYLFNGIDWITKKLLVVEYEPSTTMEAIGLCNEFSLVDDCVEFYVGKGVNFDECDSRFDPRESLAFAKDAAPIPDWDRLIDRIQTGLTEGPSDTREYFRSSVLKKFPNDIRKISWWKVYFEGEVIELPEPFDLNKQESRELVEKASSAGELLTELGRKK